VRVRTRGPVPDVAGATPTDIVTKPTQALSLGTDAGGAGKGSSKLRVSSLHSRGLPFPYSQGCPREPLRPRRATRAVHVPAGRTQQRGQLPGPPEVDATYSVAPDLSSTPWRKPEPASGAEVVAVGTNEPLYCATSETLS